MTKEQIRAGDSIKRYGLVMTDGEPNGKKVQNRLGIDPAKYAVKLAIEDAHQHRLHVIGVVLPVRAGRASYDSTLDSLDDMFDRVLVLPDHYTDAVEQLTTYLVTLMR
jgi:hypothetical protein